MITIDQMIAPITEDEALESLLLTASALGLPTTAWQSDNPLLVLLRVCAVAIVQSRNLAVEITKGGFGELLPSDTAADLWAQSRYDETRIPANPATGYVTLTNVSGSTYPLLAGELIVEKPVNQSLGSEAVTYRNSITITVAPGTTIVGVGSDNTGSLYNALPGEITNVTSSLPGVTCTNANAVLGSDAETTMQLVARCRSKLASFSPMGPKGVYDYVAKTPKYAPTSVRITRTKVSTAINSNLFQVYLATDSGVPSTSDIAIVQSSFQYYAEPWGATSQALAATLIPISVSYQVWCSKTSRNEAQIKARCDAAIAKFFASLPIGGFVIPPLQGAVYEQALQQAIGASDSSIIRVSVTSPAGTQYLSPNAVATLSTIASIVTIL